MEYTLRRREEIRKDNPKLPNRAMVSQIAEEWREMSAKKKKPFSDKALANKKRYERAMDKYIQEHGDSHAKAVKPRGVRRKRKPSGYNLYIKSQFQKLKAKKGDKLEVTSAMTELSKRWKKLSAAQRDTYTKRAAALWDD